MSDYKIDLPFIDNSQGQIKFWKVTPSDNYLNDILTGHTYAKKAINFMESQGLTPLFSKIVKDMPDEYSGIEIGFLEEIAQRAIQN